ncbi:MAG: serine/threonine-protein kinase [Acidobacteriota bacterium]
MARTVGADDQDFRGDLSAGASVPPMTPERWRRLEELVVRLEPLAASARRAVLDSECANDPELRGVLEGMLEELGRDETQDWIGSSIHGSLPEDLHQIPDRLGPYRITGEIGRGGLAVVLAAERDDREFTRRVAIKLIRRGLDTVDLLLRLRQERQILARLNHPNIATLIDGGSTDDGRPFVVMERIDGKPIDVYGRDLPLRERLELFVEVCEAVQYAHRNLVIHRDIKPANILVTAEGRPKLLDFGIAKVLQPTADSDRVAKTVPGLRLLTPEYASPEQLRGEPLTTATDVYSLGVLLYELLTGERPHALLLGDHRALEAAIASAPPERPSQRLLRRHEASAKPRGKAVTGDLDNIALMALRPEADRRYVSVEQLADDIRRYLGDMPVRARADTVGYRVAKFIRRHRLAVSVAAVSAVILVALSLVAWRQARLATQGRLASDRLSEMLVSLFELPDPGDGRGATITALEILDRGAVQALDLEEQPETQARFLDTMGRVYNNLGLYPRAEDLFEQAVALRRDLDEPLALAESLNHLGEARYHLGHIDRAEAHFEESFAIRRRAIGEDRLEQAGTLTNLGAMRLWRRDAEAAERLWRQALDIRRRHQGEHGDLAELHDNLATLLAQQGRTEEAERHLTTALDLHRLYHGEGHFETVRTMANLAALLHNSGDRDEAEDLYRHALAAQVQALGEDHPQVSRIQTNLAALLAFENRLVEAEELLRRALGSLRSRLGDDHLEVTYPMLHLADLLVKEGPARYDEAAEFFGEVRRVRRLASPADSPLQLNPLMGIARLERLRGQPAAARLAALEAQALSLQLHGAEHYDTEEANAILRWAEETLGPSGPPVDEHESTLDLAAEGVESQVDTVGGHVDPQRR